MLLLEVYEGWLRSATGYETVKLFVRQPVYSLVAGYKVFVPKARLLSYDTTPWPSPLP